MNAPPSLTGEVFFRGLIEACPDALVVTAPDGRILLVNGQTETLFGYRRTELIGQPVEILLPERFRAIHAQQRAAYERAPWARPMGAGLDLWGRRADGSEFPAEISLSPVATENGLLIISAIRDISERKQAEAERAQLLAREQAARAETEAALRLRDQALAVITHDLGQPLATIRTALQLMRIELMQMPNPTHAPLREYLALIDAATTTMLAMVGELVDLARLQAGRPLDLTYRRADLVALARAEAATQQQTTDRHQISVQATVPELVGEWDTIRLQRVLANLLANAIKYSPAGGTITVTIGTVTDGGRDWAELTVTDEGIGIPAADLPHLFEWFYRASNAIGRTQGTGIGLAGVKRIVEQHGGSIAVTSTEGKGTTVTIRLPLEQGE